MAKRYYPRDFKNVANKTDSKACVYGMKEWSANNNVNFRDFLKNGITANKIRKSKDSYAIKLLDAVISEKR